MRSAASITMLNICISLTGRSPFKKKIKNCLVQEMFSSAAALEK